MRLQQTVNAETTSQIIGISSMTISISARKRWVESHFSRRTIIEYLNEDINLTKKEDITESLT